MKKCGVLLVSVFLVSVLLISHASFALDIPDGFTRDAAVSDIALDAAKQQFSMIKQQLEAIQPGLPPDQQAAMDQAITVIDEKLARLGTIDVYFAQEATPGEKYDDVRTFYQDTLSMVQDVASQELMGMVTQVPPGMVPPQTLESLNSLIQDGKVKAASGIAEGTRVSFSTVYVHPQTMELIEGTTIVVARDK